MDIVFPLLNDNEAQPCLLTADPADAVLICRRWLARKHDRSLIAPIAVLNSIRTVGQGKAAGTRIKPSRASEANQSGASFHRSA